jgi:hypothetical protein
MAARLRKAGENDPSYRVADGLHQSAGFARGGVSLHTYRKVPSLAVATLRPLLRVARFNADRTFSLLSASCANGTLSATPFFT